MQKLLQHVAPLLQPSEYVFCTFPEEPAAELVFQSLASYREEEGLSLVLERSVAKEAGLPVAVSMRCITLGVHSSLEAVGLTAAVASALAQAGISANVIAAYHHDHILVPAGRALEALALLRGLSC